MPLLSNAKHELFAQELAKGANATDAYEKAGYKRHDGNASTLANKPDVLKRLEEIRGKAAAKTGIAVERMLSELERLSLSNMLDYTSVNSDGALQVDMANLTREQAGAIQEVVIEEFKDGRSDQRQVRRVKFKLVDKVRATELWAKMTGNLVEKHEHDHQHQGLILHALLQDIDERSRGKPIVDVMPPSLEEFETPPGLKRGDAR